MLAGSVSPWLQLAAEIALTHHERWDGEGYAGMAGEQIPLSGRIVALADVYDALIHIRPYKSAWPSDLAIEEVRSLSGSHFDPRVVGAFMEMVRNGEVESVGLAMAA
jgi:putative two-component system response regulator